MKCPICGVWADVCETRPRKDSTKRRRYQCANLHRFTTLEAVVVLKQGGARPRTKSTKN